jgi:acylphosphatase
MKKHYKLKITGKVQGVWYRGSTEQQARKLGIFGFVKNEPDGSVYAEAEGTEEQLKKLIQWCKSGPPLAKVKSVEVELGHLCGYETFEVRRG